MLAAQGCCGFSAIPVACQEWVRRDQPPGVAWRQCSGSVDGTTRPHSLGLVDTGWMAMLFTDSGDSDGETEWGGMTLV